MLQKDAHSVPRSKFLFFILFHLLTCFNVYF